MDGVSIAASVVGIAGAGVQIAIKLVTLATQISTASERVSSIGNDISLTSGVLHQLGELMTQKTTDDGISIFSKGGLETTRTSAAMCERIFLEVEKETRKASEQIRGCKRSTGGKIKLSKAEKAKWPFLQPSVDILRADLTEAKGTLMLMLQVTSLALSKRMADFNQTASSNMSEQREFMRAIVALQQAQQDQRTVKGSKQCDRTKVNPGDISGQTSSSSTARSLGSDAETDPSTAIIISHSKTLPPPPKPRARMKFKTLESSSPNQEPRIPGLPTYSEANRSREPNLQGTNPSMNWSIATIQTSNFPPVATNSNMPWPGGSGTEQSLFRERAPSNSSNAPDSEKNLELHLFLLKPIVRDFFDKIELTWSVQNTKMQDTAIRKYMAKHEKDGMPSVLDMLHTLHDYEQTLIDSEVHGRGLGPEGSLLSLKRTKTDIRHRDITLKDVPGLQFVVERPPGPPIWYPQQGLPYSAPIQPPPPAQPTVPYHAGGGNHVLQDYQMENARRKKPIKKQLSHGSIALSPSILCPQVPDEDTTDEELFRVPISSRAQGPERSPDPYIQHAPHDRMEFSVRERSRDRKRGRDSEEEDTSIRRSERERDHPRRREVEEEDMIIRMKPSRSRDYEEEAIVIRTDERARPMGSTNMSFESGAPSDPPPLTSYESQAQPSSGISPIEHKEHSYQDARVTSPTAHSNKKSKKASTGDVQRVKASIFEPSALPSMPATDKPGKPSFEVTPGSLEGALNETPENDLINLLSSEKLKLRKRGTIKRGPSNEIIEVTNPKLDSSGSLNSKMRTQPDLDLPVQELPRQRISRPLFENGNEDELRHTPIDIPRILEREGHVPMSASGLPEYDGHTAEIVYVVDSDSDITNPSIIQGPMSDYQTDNREHRSYEPSSPQFSPTKREAMEAVAHETSDPGIMRSMLGGEQEQEGRVQNRLKKAHQAMRRRNTKTVQYPPPSFIELSSENYPSQGEIDTDQQHNTDEKYIGPEKGGNKVTRDEPTSDNLFEESRRRMSYEEQGVFATAATRTQGSSVETIDMKNPKGDTIEWEYDAHACIDVALSLQNFPSQEMVHSPTERQEHAQKVVDELLTKNEPFQEPSGGNNKRSQRRGMLKAAFGQAPQAYTGRDGGSDRGAYGIPTTSIPKLPPLLKLTAKPGQKDGDSPLGGSVPISISSQAFSQASIQMMDNKPRSLRRKNHKGLALSALAPQAPEAPAPSAGGAQISQRRQAPREKETVVVEETRGPSPLSENVVVDGVEKHGLIRRKCRRIKKPGVGGRPIDMLRDEGYSIEPDTIPGEYYDVEAEVSSKDEVDDESPVAEIYGVDEELESEVEQERDGEGEDEDEDAVVNELLGKYTTLFD